MIYCVIPRELEDELLGKLTDYYRDNPNVSVIVDRRQGPDRRRSLGAITDERRVVRDRRRARATGTFPSTDVG